METSKYNKLLTSFIGITVINKEKDSSETIYKIHSLSDKIGTLKDGSKGEYVVLQSQSGDMIVMNVHPQRMKTLVTKGIEGCLTLLGTPSLGEHAKVDVIPPIVINKPGKPIPTDPDLQDEVKPLTKKALTIALVAKMVAEGAPRKDIISKMKSQLNLSAAGANTYYQNCKSKLWS